jgi:hypothetical protein
LLTTFWFQILKGGHSRELGINEKINVVRAIHSLIGPSTGPFSAVIAVGSKEDLQFVEYLAALQNACFAITFDK